MTSQKKIKNLVSAYSAIRIDYGDFMDEILLDLKEHGFSSEALLSLISLGKQPHSPLRAMRNLRKSLCIGSSMNTPHCARMPEMSRRMSQTAWSAWDSPAKKWPSMVSKGSRQRMISRMRRMRLRRSSMSIWPRALCSLQSRGTAIRCGLRTIPWKSVRTVRVRSLSGQQVSPDARAVGSQSCPARPAVAVRHPALMGIPAGLMSG